MANKEKTIKIDMGGVKDINITNDIVSELVKQQIVTSKIKKAQSGSPATKAIQPNQFYDQFYFQDDGKLWVNINNTWKAFTPDP